MGSNEKPPDGYRDHDADQREMAWARGLRAGYDRLAQESLPDRFRELMEQLENMEPRR